ncbi:MAG: hypothetical protein KIS96_09095 [Bauldia sp.]|nr:hypothetical protein [Bauldia sp.]
MAEEPTKAVRGTGRIAVLVVHGMGNQRPAATTREFVRAAWTMDATISDDPEKVWVVPDRDETDLDLPVFTTKGIADQDNRRVDFYEFYWAHVMAETRWVSIFLWLFELLRKGPGGARWDIKVAWFIAAPLFVAVVLGAVLVLSQLAAWIGGRFALDNAAAAIAVPWVLAAVVMFVAGGRYGIACLGFVAALVVAGALLANNGSLEADAILFRIGDWESLIVALGLIALYVAANAVFLETVLGDAARYYRDAPANIAVRRQARRLGVRTLERLHGDGRYDRVIVVAHSLGSVIAYDVLRAYWARFSRAVGDIVPSAEFAEQDDVGTAIGAGKPIPMDEEARTEWRARARRLAPWLSAIAATAPVAPPPAETPFGGRRAPPSWLVTDFITCGSPLTHAAYLGIDATTAGKRRERFRRKRLDRELPQNPAWREDDSGTMSFIDAEKETRRLHHAGLFGATRWTNLYFKSRLLVGDPIGGPLAHAFGEGVLDVPVTINGKLPPFSHSKYWDLHRHPDGEHLKAFRHALDLRDRDTL